MAGELLINQGHQVVLHARNTVRADDAKRALPRAEAIVEGDLGTIAGAKEVAARVNELGRFDAVIHNAAVGYREGYHLTADGLPHVFAINTLATYILTGLVERPHRLIYLSSGMHRHADVNLDDVLWNKRRWNGSTAYAESKLHDAMLGFAVSRRWPDVLSNSLEPGWVPTKMGGAGAPDDMEQAHLTRHGSPSAMNRKPRLPAATSTICVCSHLTRRPMTLRFRIASSRSARSCPASRCQFERRITRGFPPTTRPLFQLVNARERNCFQFRSSVS
jgi:NAD(P)-dependent dehydrogenase (short-subunit alcohol dehydrogenase family)